MLRIFVPSGLWPTGISAALELKDLTRHSRPWLLWLFGFATILVLSRREGVVQSGPSNSMHDEWSDRCGPSNSMNDEWSDRYTNPASPYYTNPTFPNYTDPTSPHYMDTTVPNYTDPTSPHYMDTTVPQLYGPYFPSLYGHYFLPLYGL